MKHLLSLLGFIFANTPECIMGALCKAIGWLICYFPNPRTKVAFSNIRHCFPEMSRRERMKIAYESCARMVEMALFVVASPHMSAQRLSQRVKLTPIIREKLAEFTASPYPLVLMIPHFAMMETITMFPLIVGAKNIPTTGVFYRPFNSKGMESWVKESRQRFGIEMLSRRDGIFHAAKILKGKGCVAVLYDQNAGGAGCESLFFDRVCYTSELAGILVEKAKAKCAVMFAKRTGFWRSEVSGEFLEASEIEDITYTGNKWLENRLKESQISRYDWLWLHRRWRIRCDQRTSLHLRGGKSILDYSLKRMGLSQLPRKTSIFVTLPDSFADVDSLAPILRNLRKSRPDAALTLLCSESCAAVFRKFDDCVDEVVKLPSRISQRWQRIKTFRQLSFRYPDINIVFDNSPAADIEAFILGAQQRNAIQRNRRRRFMTAVYKTTFRAANPEDECAVYLQMLKYFGMKSEGDV